MILMRKKNILNRESQIQIFYILFELKLSSKLTTSINFF